MINFLSGKILRKHKQAIILLVEGVGYEIFLSPVHLVSLKVGNPCELYTHLYLRDNSQELYGFPNTEQLDFFRMLLNVSGVGPKSALNVLSLGSVSEIKNAIVDGDINFLTKVSGIGRKTAERMVVELKDKAGGDAEIRGEQGVLGDVVDALQGLGYKLDEARTAVRGLDVSQKNVETLLREALRRMAR